MALLDDELQALYRLRPEDFVGARNDLVRALRKAGRRDDAALVSKLRRPSATAAALNRVALDEPQLVDALLAEWERLRDALQRAVEGNAVDVRPAQAAERQATDAVVVAARRHLEQLGLRDSDVAAQRINNTLRAAALDESLAQQLRRGMLDTDVVASGFGFAGIAFDEGRREPAPRKKTVRAVAEETAPSPDHLQEEREAAARHTALLAEATQLAATAARLGANADDAQQQADQLREQVAFLQEQLRDADRAARSARRAADKAGLDATRAQQRADGAPATGDAQTR